MGKKYRLNAQKNIAMNKGNGKTEYIIPTKKIKFEWRYQYVAEGEINPDKYGRWAIYCYMFIHIDKALPKYKSYKGLLANNKNYLPVRVATISQKETSNDFPNSLASKYYVQMPTFDNAGNGGMAYQHFYSNDIEELKQIVEKQFEQIRNVFKYCL